MMDQIRRHSPIFYKSKRCIFLKIQKSTMPKVEWAALLDRKVNMNTSLYAKKYSKTIDTPY